MTLRVSTKKNANSDQRNLKWNERNSVIEKFKKLSFKRTHRKRRDFRGKEEIERIIQVGDTLERGENRKRENPSIATEMEEHPQESIREKGGGLSVRKKTTTGKGRERGRREGERREVKLRGFKGILKI